MYMSVCIYIYIHTYIYIYIYNIYRLTEAGARSPSPARPAPRLTK